MHVIVSTPTYDAKVHLGYMNSMLNLINLCQGNEIELEFNFTSHTLIDRSRDELAYKAMIHPTATHMLFVDADLSFAPEVPGALFERSNLPIVAATYPRRGVLPLSYVVAPKPGAEVKENGAIEVTAAPTGMMLIKTEVLRSMAEKATRYAHRMDPIDGIPRLFGYEMFQNHLMGEDFSFCISAARAGFATHVVPGLLLNHHGDFTYSGAWNGSPETVAKGTVKL